jgi:lipoprotein NlpD
MRARVSLMTLMLLVAVVGGCTGGAPAPIEDHSRPGSIPASQSYRVLRGDTLFSIAFRYGLDYRRLAAANRIGEPYTIYVGQSLLLAEADSPPSPPVPRPASSPAKDKTSPSTGVPPAGASRPAAKKSPPVTAAPKTPAASSPPVDNKPVGNWRWPAKGKLTRSFDGARHKGVDVSGKRGDDVFATAGGRVVYAGSGIAGYGLMLIVRHNNEYLSAYGHNDALLVGEGDSVNAGQRVARMGSSGTDTVKLHFELRRHGRPVDPLRLLPRR